MYKQLSLSQSQDELLQVMTRKKEVLEHMERIFPSRVGESHHD